MASVTSLGIHNPAGLPYLRTERTLARGENSFGWVVTNNEFEGSAGDEEIIITNYSVVWSHGGIVRRVFRFDDKRGEAERFPREKINLAILTRFSSESRPQFAIQGGPETFSAHVLRSGWPVGEGVRELRQQPAGPEDGGYRALVIFFRTQAYVYFLSGASHVLHMPFEVARALPSPRGLVLQRKLPLPPLPAVSFSSPMLPPPPQNSFYSSQQQSLSITSSQSTVRNPSVRFESDSLTIPHLFKELLNISHADSPNNLPSLYSLSDPELEMGLVVVAPSTYLGSFSGSLGPNTGSPGTLSPAETMVYISYPEGSARPRYSSDPMFTLPLAVTVNAETSMYTVWSVAYVAPELVASAALGRTSVTGGTLSRRRSSYGPNSGTGATTPVGYGPTTSRDSFGGAIRSQAATGSSNPNPTITLRKGSDSKNQEDQLASSLDFDYGKGGVPARNSRRVSSLVARADLSTNHDRLAFSGLASGGAANSNSVHSGSFRRGDSLGGYTTRGNLLCNSGASRRSSTPGAASFGSSGYQDVPIDDLLEELNAGGDFEGFEGMEIQAANKSLKKEVVLTKIESFAIDQVQSRDTTRPSISGDELNIFTLVPPSSCGSFDNESDSLVLCIANKMEMKLLTLSFSIRCQGGLNARYHGKHRSTATAQSAARKRVPSLVDVERASGVIDAVRIVDGDLSRILVLSKTEDGSGELTIKAPWSPAIKIELPLKLAILNPCELGLSPYELGHVPFSGRGRRGGLKRIFSRGTQSLKAFCQETRGGKVTVLDGDGNRHRIRIQMQPRNKLVQKALDVCRWVLPGKERGGEGILVGWWQARRWLQQQGNARTDEWTALILVIWCMAVSFISEESTPKQTKHRKRKSVILRSSSSTSIDLESWESLTDLESTSCKGVNRENAWLWDLEEDDEQSQALPLTSGQERLRHAHSDLSSTFMSSSRGKKNPLLVDCIALARDFLKSPAGKEASGRDGYLPTAMGRAPTIRGTALATILVGLHLLREELKLDITTADSDAKALTPVLAQLGSWLGWDLWGFGDHGYYSLEDIDMQHFSFSQAKMTGLTIPGQPFSPPSVYEWLSRSFLEPRQQPFLTLKDIVSPSSDESESTIGQPPQNSTDDWRYTLTPYTSILTSLFSYMSSNLASWEDIIQAMVKAGINSQMLETLPDGLSVPLREAILRCQEDPPTSWTNDTLELLGREDLKDLFAWNEREKEFLRTQVMPAHKAYRDIHSICNSTLDIEAIGSFDGSAEIDRQAVTRLVFKDDQRFAEACKLLQTSKATVAKCVPEPEWSESDLLDAQKEVAYTVAFRTLAVPSGRGLVYFSARAPLITEKFPIGGFNLSCVMKPSNNTVSADKVAFTEEKVGWAFFHAGVASGLTISRDATGVDSSWIMFNRPAELNNRHAGFLLALGLNGHLKSVAKWVAFKYLTPKHTMSSIGLLLGLSASYLGTMDALVTRLLSVHVIRMLPPGAAELNLSPLTQTTGIMGIGLLYCNTQHRRMSEIMLSEIEHIEHEDPLAPVDTLRDEGYRLAAGFALGFINLGKGNDLKGLHDMHLVERLLSLAVGSKKVSIVHVLDKSTAAATVAITLIFMKSHDKALARKIDVPDTVHQFDYIRPDIFLLRTLARHLIMWDDIQGTFVWIKKSLPKAYSHRALMSDISSLSTDDLPLFNIITGLCFSIGLRFAGSGSVEVRTVLIWYLDKFIRLCRLPAMNYDQKLTRNTVYNCQDVLALAAASVMAGRGDLQVFRRLRSLHGRTDIDTTYGSHLAAHTAIGVLFLGGGTHTFGTSNLAVASLMLAFYPLSPNNVQDNTSHLQAFRHFWVLATEARCLVPRDVETHRPICIPIIISLRDGTEIKKTAPCLLPELNDIASIATASPEYWKVVLDFADNKEHLAAFKKLQTVLIRRRSVHESKSSVFQTTLQALSDTEAGQSSLEWLLQLKSFAGLDKSERALLLPPDAGIPVHASMQSSVVDTRLMLEKASLSGDDADRLRNVNILFSFVNKMKADRPRYITDEVVNRLRAAVWTAFND